MGEPPAPEFHDDPASFLEAAGDYLLERPVLSTIVTTQAHREAAAAPRRGPASSSDPRWYVVVHDEAGEVVGAAMRTAGYPPYLLDMPQESAAALARLLVDRGECVDACNGALPAARIFAEQVAARTGRRAEVMVHTRLFELSTLIEPRVAPGTLRRATVDDLDLAIGWFRAFLPAADAQSGRPPWGHHPRVTREDVADRIEAGGVWLWENPIGTPVHLTCAHPPALGVRRIGPVYTPAEHRGHGYASTAVAEVSRMILAEGARACLFTDRANPVSNGIYEAIGYRPVVELANLVVREVI